MKRLIKLIRKFNNNINKMLQLKKKIQMINYINKISQK